MGAVDIPLNATGIEQAQHLSQYLCALSVQTICCSPLQRATATADIFQQAIGCNVVVIDELQEFNLGAYGGRLIGEWFHLWRCGKLIPPNGESFETFVHRAITGVAKALQHDGVVLVVAHGGIYWALQHALQLQQLPDLPNCQPAYFSLPGDAKRWSCSHLKLAIHS